MEDKGARAGMPERARDAGEGMSAPPRQRRLSVQRKQEVVLRLLRGEDLDLVSRGDAAGTGGVGHQIVRDWGEGRPEFCPVGRIQT